MQLQLLWLFGHSHAGSEPPAALCTNLTTRVGCGNDNEPYLVLQQRLLLRGP